LARGGAAATEQQEGRGWGDLRRESGVRVFSHRQSAFLLSGVPERTSGGGDGLGSPDGLRPYSGRENKELGARLGRITPPG
jgi:hypothetical protein